MRETINHFEDFADDIIKLLNTIECIGTNEVERILVTINSLEEAKEKAKEMLTLAIVEGYESDKFEIVQRKKVEFVDPIEAEEVLFEKFGERIYTKKMKSMGKLTEMIEEAGVEVSQNLGDPFIKRIPTSEKALAKRKEIEKGE